ncbi:MAG TPA: hypothetical protein ENJ80_02880 [Gammaproteobacteria bacterium]|nr:hypothetical protein [Gammaproteobacteria bacterium]
MLTDDYTLAILPLACLIAEKPVTAPSIYHKVLRSGVLGYQLYTYHNLVRARFSEQVEQRVRERQLALLSHLGEFGPLLAIINDAVDIGAVTTPTSQGEVVTPVEMTVALALLLGLPESLHYVTHPGQRGEEIARMSPEIDWYFADLLAHGRREMVEIFATLVDKATQGSATDSGVRKRLHPAAAL